MSRSRSVSVEAGFKPALTLIQEKLAEVAIDE